jgi:formate hydrogenlyase subunit 6/NADH:ubiquinone oxidoreductase subunit I
MPGRGLTQKRSNQQEIVLERAMVTRHYLMRWDLDRCVGCQIGPTICPVTAISHVDAVLENGHMVRKQTVDVDKDKCIFCGECVEMCPVSAIEMTVNGEAEIPVIKHEAFPELIGSNLFDPKSFDWSRVDFVIDNCPTDVISYNEQEKTLEVEDKYCIRCRQCEGASNGAFKVEQPWKGVVVLRRELCVEGCLACADICPTRALHIDDKGELVLADYYCIKCGACMQICPVKPQTEEYEITTEAYGVTKTVKHQRITNSSQLPVYVERWRVAHTPVQSGAWLQALLKVADEKAGMVEIDRKRALRRRDLILSLKGGHEVGEEKPE